MRHVGIGAPYGIADVAANGQVHHGTWLDNPTADVLKPIATRMLNCQILPGKITRGSSNLRMNQNDGEHQFYSHVGEETPQMDGLVLSISRKMTTPIASCLSQGMVVPQSPLRCTPSSGTETSEQRA